MNDGTPNCDEPVGVPYDLERRRLDAALRASEARFRALATVGSSSVYRMSPDWREMRALDGAAFLADTAAPTADWVDDYIPPDERPRVRDAIDRAIAARGVFELEHRVRRADGTVGWTFSRAIPLLDDAGDITEWFGAATDVTARVRADQRFKRLFQAAPAPFLVLKPDAPRFTIAEVNDAYLAATMRTRGDVVGRGVFEAYPANPSDTTNGSVHALQASLDRVLATRQPDTLAELKYDIARPDGSFEERWWRPVNSAVLGDDGEVEALIHNANDVTDQRRTEAALRASEAKYRTLFETMGQGYALVELVRDAAGRAIDQRYLAFNPAIERLLHTPAADATGRLASEVFPTIEPYWTEIFDRVVREALPERIEHCFGPLDRWFEVYAYPVGGDRFVALYEDITDRRHAETARRESEARQAFLLRLSDALRPLADPLAVQIEAMRVLGQHLAVDRTQYHEIEPGNEYIVPGGGYANGVPLHPGRSRMDDFGAFVREAYEGGRTLVVADTEHDPRLATAERAAFAGIGVRAFVAVPLVKNGRFVGVLGLDHTTPREWSDAEIALAEEVAERTWAAVERARAEAALRDSEARLAAAFEGVPVGAAVIDVAGSVVVANAEFRRFLPAGVIPSRDPARGDRWRAWDTAGRRLDPADYPGARALRGERGVPGQEMLFTDDDGHDVWTSVAAVPIRAKDGPVTGFVCAIGDIDALRRGGDALRDSESRFRQFSDASTNILWIRNAATLRMEFASPAFDRIYGMPGPERGGDPGLRAWVRLIEPASRRTVLANFRRVRAGERIEMEFQVRRATDGALRWVRNTDFPLLDAAGRVERVAGLGEDVTDLKEAERALADAEQRQRTLMEGIPQLVWRSCDQGLWTWASPQWLDFTGQTQDEAHGLGWLDAVHPDDQAATRWAWDEARPHGTLDIDYRVRRAADGAWVWHHTRSVPVRDADGRITEWLGTSTDIQNLRELQGRQDVLVAELQHRTRNLIAVVRSLSDRTLGNAASLDDFGQRFRLRLSALSRVQGLLSDLTVGERVTFRELLWSELVAHGAANGMAHKVTLDGPADVALRSASVQTLALAIHELATNAAKYGALAAADGHLFVGWRVEPAAGSEPPRLHVEWRETGVAMPDADAPQRGSGYGRELIERALPYQLKAKTTYEMGADGVRCTIALPIAGGE